MCTVPFREGEGGKKRNVHYPTSTTKLKAQNKCDGGRAQGGKYVKWLLKMKEMGMMMHLLIQISVPVWACASTRTDPNTRTGMSITGNGNLHILVPTYILRMAKVYR